MTKLYETFRGGRPNPEMHLGRVLLLLAASARASWVTPCRAPRAFALAPAHCRRSLPRCAEVENAAPLVEPPVAMKDIIDTAVSTGSFL